MFWTERKRRTFRIGRPVGVAVVACALGGQALTEVQAQMRALPPATGTPLGENEPARPGSPGASIVSPELPPRPPLPVGPPTSAPATPPVNAPAAGPPVGSIPPPPAPVAPAAPPQAPQVPAGQVALMASARFGRDAPQQIPGGLHWRIYSAKPDAPLTTRPLREERAAAPTFLLPPGPYVVHVTFGLASAAKTVSLRSETVREVFDLPAGALRLEGRVGDARIPPAQISFDLFPGSQFDPRERQPIAQKLPSGELVIVPEGTYYIVSNYGDGNAVVRSDIRVQAAKLTDVRVNHRAAAITLKLVGERGGEALANTSWTVLTPGGDVITESTGAFPRVILAEGDYRAIARYESRTFERQFKVVTGVDGEIEVVAQ